MISDSLVSEVVGWLYGSRSETVSVISESSIHTVKLNPANGLGKQFRVAPWAFGK